MKKFIFAIGLLLCATASLFSAVHVPAAPWIGDNMPIANPNQRGTIMQIITNNPDFAQECAAIRTFLNIPNNGAINQTYQNIVTHVKNAPAYQPGALETLEAFEKAIMHHLHTQNYIIAFENKWLNIGITGIRWNWVNPSKWLQPSYWYSDNSPILQDCMQELLALATIADNHSIITATRMRAIVESYLHWRRNIAAAIGVYLTANLVHNGWQKSSLKMLKSGGFDNIGKVTNQAGKDIVDFVKYSAEKISSTPKIIGGYVQPIINTILHGDGTSTKNNEQSISSGWMSNWTNNDLRSNWNNYIYGFFK